MTEDSGTEPKLKKTQNEIEHHKTRQRRQAGCERIDRNTRTGLDTREGKLESGLGRYKHSKGSIMRKQIRNRNKAMRGC